MLRHIPSLHKHRGRFTVTHSTTDADIEHRKALVLQNTEEIVTDAELDNLLDQDSPRCYVGYETSGPVHLGHWISIRKLLDLQQAGFQPIVLWADRHTQLNRKGNEAWIRDMAAYWQAVFEALGLDADYTIGSDFQRTADYTDDLLQLSERITINRGTRAMSDVAKDGDAAYISEIIYPLMQALDIAHLDVDLAVAGIDQRRIHMLAREHVPALGYEKPTCLHWPLLTALDGSGDKMSSSDAASMFPLHAAPGRIRDTIQNAYCPAEQVDGNPMVEIARFFVFGADQELAITREAKYGGDVTYDTFDVLADDFKSGEIHPAALKPAIAETVVTRLQPVRDRITQEPELLKPLLEEGYDRPAYLD